MQSTESKIKLWEERISSWEISGESMRKFCFKKGISPSTFRRWKKVLRKKVSPKKTLFTEIKTEEAFSKKPSKIELIYKGIRIYLNEDFDIQILKKITKALIC